MYRLPALFFLAPLVAACLLLSGSAAAGSTGASWNKVPVPSAENALILPGSDVLELAGTVSGCLYAAVEQDGGTFIYSSPDGWGWEPGARVESNPVDLCASPADGARVYYATAGSIYRSVDGGSSFSAVSLLPGFPSPDRQITGIDVVCLEGEDIIAASVRDGRTGEYGGLYLLKNGLFTTWMSPLEDSDIFDVKFVPSAGPSLELAAIGVRDGECFFTGISAASGWSTCWNRASFTDNEGAPVGGLNGARLAFSEASLPGEPVFFAGLDTGTGSGDVYRVVPARISGQTLITDLDADARSGENNLDISCIDAGRGTILAAVKGQARYLVSFDGGWNWQSESVPGQAITGTLAAPELLWISTTGPESGVSVSADGSRWQQAGLLDIRIDALVDFDICPWPGQDPEIYLLTWGGASSLWSSPDNGQNWQRLTVTVAAPVDFEKVATSFQDGKKLVVLAGTGPEGRALWCSADGGMSFKRSDIPLRADCLKVGYGAVAWAGFDGQNAYVYISFDGGSTFTGSPVGSVPISCLDLATGPSGNLHVLAATSGGGLFLSTDEGQSFDSLERPSHFTGCVSAAFDTRYASNGRIYVACDDPGAGIYTGGLERDWQRVDGQDPGQQMIGNIACSATGIVYASDFSQADREQGCGGLVRMLNPGIEGGICELMLSGLEEEATLWRCRVAGTGIWAMDTTHNGLVWWKDELALAPRLILPPDGATKVGSVSDEKATGIGLEWAESPGAEEYEWQLSKEADFTDGGLAGLSSVSHVELPPLDLSSSYYWRVRVTGPLHSPWSGPFSFTTGAEPGLAPPLLIRPGSGEEVSPEGLIFEWRGVTGAVSYQIMVSDNPGFTNPDLDRSLDRTTFVPSLPLEYETGYFWQVRAIGESGYGPWSIPGNFSTGQVPPRTIEPSTPPQQTVTATITAAPPAISPAPTLTLSIPVPEAGEVVVPVPPPGLRQERAMPGWFYIVVGLAVVMGMIMVLLISVIIARRPGKDKV